MKTDITDKIRKAVFDDLYKYTCEHKDDPVIFYPKVMREGWIAKYGITMDQVHSLTNAFVNIHCEGKFYKNPLDILKDVPEHEEYVMREVFGPDYKSLTEEEKQQILEKRNL